MRRQRALSDGDIKAAAYVRYSSTLEVGDRERTSPTAEQIQHSLEAGLAQAQSHPAGSGIFDAISSATEAEVLANKVHWASRRRRARLNRLKADLGKGDTRIIEPEADRYIRESGLRASRGSNEYRYLCLSLMRGEIEALQRTFEREAGDFSGVIIDPLVVAAEQLSSSMSSPSESLNDLLSKYERANPRNMQADSFKQVRRDIENFISFVGPKFPAKGIDRQTVARWMDVLYDYPIKATETAQFKGLRPQDAAAVNKTLDSPKATLSTNTVRRYLSSLGGFCRWLKKRSVLAENPVADMAPERERKNERRSFTIEEMRIFLSSPLFKGCQGDGWHEMAVPGGHRIRDHRFWVPLVMAYSGARPGEIAQLHISDVREQNGVWIMHITELGEGDKRTKTEGSMRVVPLHSTLIKTGFVKHCQSMADQGNSQVFPEVHIPSTGQIIPEFSREMNRTYLPKIGLKQGRDIVLYSLRHTVVDHLRRANVAEEDIGILIGHGKATMTGRYGTEPAGTIAKRQQFIELIHYGV